MKTEGEIFIALYDYQPPENASSSVLSFQKGEKFLLVKKPEAETDWYWVCNEKAIFGYVPTNFVRIENLSMIHLGRTLTNFMQIIQSNLESTNPKNKKHLQHQLLKLDRKLQQISLSLDNSNSGGSEVRVRFQDEDESMASSRLESIGRMYVPTTSRSNSRSGQHSPLSIQNSNDALNSILKSQIDKTPSPEPCSKLPQQISPFEFKQSENDNRESYSNTEVNTNIDDSKPIRNGNDSFDSQNSSEETNDTDKTDSDSIEKPKHIEPELEDTLFTQTVIDMLQQLRITGDLPYSQCQQVLFQLLRCLQTLPNFSRPCTQLISVLCNKSHLLDEEQVCKQSQDYEHIDSLLEQLRPFAKDTQQHNWPGRRDEGSLSDLLQALHTLLHRANRAVVLIRIRQNQYECVRDWIEHVQEERQPLVRLWLHRCLLLVGLLDPIGVSHQLLGSSILVHLTNQLTKQWSVLKSRAKRVRWLAAARLFTLTLSSGLEPCSGLSTAIDRSAIEQLLTLIERTNDESSGTNEQVDDQQLDAVSNHHEDQTDTSRLTMDDLVAPLLAFNLRFNMDHGSQNPLIGALLDRPETAALLLPHLALQLNWLEDPTSLTTIRCQVEKQFDIKLPEIECHPRTTVYEANAVLKLLIEMLAQNKLALAMYVNDISVLVDIIITNLNNLQPEDPNRLGMIRLLHNIVKHSTYTQESNKISDIMLLINNLIKCEVICKQESDMAMKIRQLLTN